MTCFRGVVLMIRWMVLIRSTAAGCICAALLIISPSELNVVFDSMLVDDLFFRVL